MTDLNFRTSLISFSDYNLGNLAYTVDTHLMRMSELGVRTQNKEIYRKGHSVVQRVALFLCKNYSVSGQKAEQPASTACLLPVLLINMHAFI